MIAVLSLLTAATASDAGAEAIPIALSYDDVLLVPQRSSISSGS